MVGDAASESTGDPEVRGFMVERPWIWKGERGIGKGRSFSDRLLEEKTWEAGNPRRARGLAPN